MRRQPRQDDGHAQRREDEDDGARLHTGVREGSRKIALSPTALGASVGAMAGLVAVTVLQFDCVYQEALHLLLWHWSVLAIKFSRHALTDCADTDDGWALGWRRRDYSVWPQTRF